MPTQKTLKIIAGGVFIIIAVYLWPQYQKQIPRTKEEKASIVLAEISQIPTQAPLTLITEPDDGIGTIKNAIEKASKTLDLVIYELEDPEIEKDLINAQNRGVKVRVILQNVNVFGKRPNQKAYDFLKSQGVPIIWAQKYFALTHQKTLIVDGVWSLIMTFNLNPKYYGSSRDFALINRDPEDIAAIEEVFESDWKGSRVTARNGKDLVWSPGSTDTLLALINSASKSLDIYNEEMAEPRIKMALKKAAERGVNVRVNMTYATNWKKALNELADAGVNVRTYASTARLYIHAKVIIADNRRAFVGSENFSTQSLDLNRELGILISRPDIISSLEETFNKDWLGSRPFGSSTATKQSPNPAESPAKSGLVKLSKTGICHPPDSSSYNQTKDFTPYNNINECLAAGGRLPANYKK